MKKVLKNFGKPLTSLFPKKKEKDETQSKKEEEWTKNEEGRKGQKDELDVIVENLKKIQLEYEDNAKKDVVAPKVTVKNVTLDTNRNNDDDDNDTASEECDEFDNFTYKKVENDRNDSMSSKDSGFNDLNDKQTSDDEDVLVKDFEDLDERKSEKKKVQKVFLPRGPIRNGRGGDTTTSPYHKPILHQYINSNTFTGCQVKFIPQADDLTDVTSPNNDLDICQIAIQEIENRPFTEEDIINMYQDITQDTVIETDKSVSKIVQADNLADFEEIRACVPDFVPTVVGSYPAKDGGHLGIISPENETMFQDFDSFCHSESSDDILTSMLNPALYAPETVANVGATVPQRCETEELLQSDLNLLLTPPNSNQSMTVACATPSPQHNSNDSYNMSGHFSPSSNVLNRDYESYQVIQSKDLVHDKLPESYETEVEVQKAMTMKNFKDAQRKLMANFAQLRCCKKEEGRKVMKEAFLKMDANESKALAMKVAGTDLKTVKLMLMHTLVVISNMKTNQESLYALYGLLSERILNERADEFLTDDGLKLLTVSVLRCPRQPVLTAVLVECINIAIKTDVTRDDDKPIFKEADPSGNTLLAACAQAGDYYARGLAEIAKSQVPLFDVDHVNNEGFTALHQAIRAHGSAVRCLDTVHVLIAHAKADIYKGDGKGGETPLHLAVNSSDCDLDMILTLFGHVDTKMWKDFSHRQNRSSITPIQYARAADKSTSRTNYPKEVLNFLTKCRQTPTKNSF